MRGIRLWLTLPLVLVAAVCTSGNDRQAVQVTSGPRAASSSSSAGGSMTTSTATATTGTTSPDATTTTTTSAQRVEGHAEPCPNVVMSPPPDREPDDYREAERQQERMIDDSIRAMEYGRSQPDDFAGVKLSWRTEPRVVVGFTDRLDEHCWALREFLEYPDEFEVWPARWTERARKELERDVMARIGPQGMLRSAGWLPAFTEPTEIRLRADGEHLAVELHADYRDLVDLWVGRFPYPRSRITTADACTAELDGDRPLGVQATIQLEDGSVGPGLDGHGTLMVRNTGVMAFSIVPQPRWASTVRPGTASVVGALDLWGRAAIGYLPQRVGPGEAVDVPLQFGTASCDPALGYALPPGAYSVRDVIAITWESGETQRVLSEEARLEVTDAP